MWSVYAEFPKKYKGAIARLYCSSEDGGESIYILCDNEQGDRELSYEEMEPLRKSKSFNITQFWEEIRNPKPLPKETAKPKVTGKRKNELIKEVEVAFDIARRYKYEQIIQWYNDLGTVIDLVVINDWCSPKIFHYVEPKMVFTWKSIKTKDELLKVIFKGRKTLIEFKNSKTGEQIKEEYNEINLNRLFAKLDAKTTK